MNQNLPRKSNGRLAFLLLSLLLSLFTATGAQTCPTGSLTLSSQAQIDAFPTDYPGIVEYEAAELVASSFFRKRGFYNIGVKPILAYQATLTRSNVQDGESKDTPLFYAFNNGGNGYVIVAASYYAEPILAYSKERAFDYQSASPGAKYWLKKYEKQIAWIIQNKNGKARKEINAKWDQWLGREAPADDLLAVADCNDESYLLRTTWSQGQYYNSMCPEGPDGHALVGCVALAMGQVMKYWNYPASGTGSVNYQHVDYGMISADFGATNYQWWNMPNSINNYNNSISTLLSHCGISVYMDYGPDVSGAYTLISGSSPGSAQAAYSTYFNFQSPTPYERAGHTDSEWSNLIIAEMNAGRPVQYEAFDTFSWPWQSNADGGHSFVIDGYNSDDNTFHINWGWGGSSDGWYLINDLTPGNYNFDDDEKMLTNIRPNFTIPDGNDDDFQNATYIGGTSINLSGELTPGDSDWYSFDYNGSTYYFELIGEGFYAVDFSITGNVVNIETLPLHGKATTEVILYDTDGITEFGRDAGSGQYCSFSILSYSFPQETPVTCTSLITPSTTSNVDVNTVFQWSQVQEATSYQLTIGTTPGSGDLYNEILSQNSFSPPNELPYGATLYINVRPFNSQNSATGCQEIILTTEPVPIPDITCTNLITPLNNATDVSINTSLSWADVPGATGYYISVIGSQTGFILDNVNLVYGNSYYELPEPLPYGEVISVTITPYNQNEVAVNCFTETFTTEAAPPTCSDGIQNGDETGVDCGGVLCSPCPPGELDLQLADACVTYTTLVCDGDMPTATTTLLNPNAEDWRGRVLFRWEDVNDPSNYFEFLFGNQTYIIPAGQTAQINATLNTSVVGPGDYVLTISESYFDGSNQPWELVVDGASCINYFGLTVQDCGSGCTDPTAHNYNPAATQDDGSCETCTDGIQNGDETGVDCGGTLCDPCDCIHPDYAALEIIYNSLGGDNWTVSNHGWLSDCDPCSWYGIECDQGRVTCIDLDGNVSCNNSDFGSGIGASGDISNIAGISLPFLESFHLSNNSVSGNIPDFQNIPNLIHLGLSNNQLAGTIPNFSNLVNLTHLFLESNFLTGNIPEFNGMASLTNFHASDNLLEGSLPAFEYSPNIWTVYVDNNNLSGEIPVIENMNYFIIESNDFSGCFPDYVCDLVLFRAINNVQLPWGGDSYNFCVLGMDQTGEGSCPEPQLPGCTDPTAHNYNPATNQDDGSCETCSDGIQNGDETAIDCGGMLCGPCPIDPPSITAFTEGEILDNGCSNEGRPDEGITIPLAWTAVAGADLYNVVLAVTGASVPLLNSNTVLTSSVYECTACFTNAASIGVKVRARVNGTWTAFSPTVTGYFEPVNTDCPDCIPAAGCNNITAELGPDGHLFLTPGMIDDGTSEACGTGTLSLDEEYFTCDDLGLQTVTLTATDGNGGSASCTAQVTIVPGTDLPAGWSATDIGDPGSGSDYAYNPCIGPKGAFDISTGGYNLFPGNADEVAFVHRPLCGDGGIQADVEAITNGYAGIMIRESSAPGSKMTAIYSSLSSLLRRETRYETGGDKSTASSFAPFAARLRLVRQGDWIRGFYRIPGGSSWQLFHQVYLPMSQCVEMGLAVFTTAPNGQASATFGRVNWLSSGNGNLSVPDLDMATAEPLAAPRLFPNPSGGQFTLSFDQVLPAPATVVLRNPVGQVLEQRNLQMGTVQTEWNLGHHPDGLYLLEVRQEGQAPFLLRLIKTK